MRAILTALLISATLPARAENLATTDPSTWSKDGYLQFRWGMGTGDVHAALSAPGAVLRSSSKLMLKTRRPGESSRIAKYEIGSTPFELGGSPMDTVYFWFFDGSLYAVVMIPAAHSIQWPSKLADLLSGKYGKADSTNHAGTYTWHWRHPGANIALVHIKDMSMLTYASPEIAKRAALETEGARAAEQQAKDKADAEKL